MTPTRAALHTRWLLRVRWLVGAAQVAVIAGTAVWVDPELPIVPLLVVVAIGLAVNVALAMTPKRLRSPVVLGLVMTLDTGLLMALLGLYGGASNPFTALFLVQVALASILLTPTWAWVVTASSVLAYSALFLVPVDPHAHHQSMTAHLAGMWLAFVAVAPFLAFTITLSRRATDEADRRVALAAADQARAQQLTALATLAAGAAHELRSPLSTIAVVASDLQHSAQTQGDEPLVADATLIRSQVDRCSDILWQLSADAGGDGGEERRPVAIEDLFEDVLDDLERPDRVRHDAPQDVLDRRVLCPPRLLRNALKGLVRNAMQAGDGPVVLGASLHGHELHLEVRDEGSGMDEATLQRALDPFFTTKGPGEGMGLGLFYTQSVAEQLGGRLALTSELHVGTTATLILPEST